MNRWIEQGREAVETIVAALLGIVIFAILQLPAPALSGAMVGVACLLALGRQASLHPWLRDLGMLLGGVTMGSMVTPEMLQGFQRYPVSLLLLTCSMAATMVVTQVFYRRIAGWDKATAFFASAPGALSAVLAVAADTKADLLKVTMAQSFRLFMLVAVLPSLVAQAGDVGSLAVISVATPLSLTLTLLAGAGFAILLQRVGMAAPWIFGGMMMSAILHGSAMVTGNPPSWLMQLGFGLVGIYIGTRFSRITRKLLLDAFTLSLGAFLLGLIVAMGFASLASFLAGVPFGQALVAFAPGGLEAMVILSIALGLDPLYVSLHHLTRFLAIGVLMQISVHWLQPDP